MKIQDAKAAADKDWKKLETIPAQQPEKVKSKKEVILEAHRDKKEIPLCCFDGHVPPPKTRSWNPNYRSTQAESCSVVTL